MRGVQVVPSSWRSLPYVHVGARFSELEFQRYRPRTSLTRLLNSYDLVQFAVGTPPWACAAAEVQRPVLLWTATTTWADRQTAVSRSSPGRRIYAHSIRQLIRKFEREALRDSDCVLALSEYTQASLSAIVPDREIVLAPCGVDTSRFRPAVEVARQSYMLSVSRFHDPRKNVRMLFESYAEFRRTAGKSPPELWLAGEPPAADALRFAAELGITDSVRILGVRPDDELVELYRNARLFVLSSDEEGLAIAILEAMACGVPVASTASGGPATAVITGETGLLTQVGDPRSLADAMRQILESEVVRKQMGEAGRAVAERRFSLTATGRVFLDLYAEQLRAVERVRPGEVVAGSMP